MSPFISIISTVPDWPQFLDGCIRYRRSLDEQAPDAPRTTETFDTSAAVVSLLSDQARANTGGRLP